MIVVSDTSPINFLVLVDAIEVLPTLFQEVFLPPSVLSELAHHRAPHQVRNWAKQLPNWVQVRAPMHVEQGLRLDVGEIEAIALASELGDATLLVDERDAAKLAAQRGLTVIGTLAVLAEAAANDILDLAVTMDKLLKTNFRCPAPLIAELLRRDAERRHRS